MSISVTTGLSVVVVGTILICCCASLCTGRSSNSKSKQGLKTGKSRKMKIEDDEDDKRASFERRKRELLEQSRK